MSIWYTPNRGGNWIQINFVSPATIYNQKYRIAFGMFSNVYNKMNEANFLEMWYNGRWVPVKFEYTNSLPPI